MELGADYVVEKNSSQIVLSLVSKTEDAQSLKTYEIAAKEICLQTDTVLKESRVTLVHYSGWPD